MADTEWVVEHACRRKRPLGRRAARDVAARARSEGEDVHAYRCPFADGQAHWHVGHTPSMDGLKDLARAIRDRAGNAPGPTGAPS